MIEKLIDTRNEKLWSKINENFNVSFQQSDNGIYGCYSEGRKIIFKVDKNNLSIDLFTHEMLHGLMHLNDSFIGASARMKIKIGENYILSTLLPSEQIDNFGNCLDHIKIFPIFHKIFIN